MERILGLIPLDRPTGRAIESFFEAHAPHSLRFRGTMEEAGGPVVVWVDDPAAPRVAALASRGWLALLGAPADVADRLGDLEAISAGLEESEGFLKLSALPAGLREVLRARRRLVRENLCGLYTLRPEGFSPCAEGPPVDSLREEEAPVVAAHSPYEQGAAYCLGRIRSAPTAALRVDGELASYMVVHANGSIGMLHTMEKFRNRRLGRRVTSALVERQLARGREVYCYIVEGNEPSQRVFTSLGFQRAADVWWSVFERGGGPGA